MENKLFRVDLIKSVLSYIIIIFSFFPFIQVYVGSIYGKIYVFVLVIYLLFSILKRHRINLNSNNFYIYLFLAIWFIYNTITYFWAKDQMAVIQQSSKILIYFSIVFVISQEFNSWKKLHFLFIGFNLIAAVYILIAIWEFTSLHHLAFSRFVEDDILIFIPSGPFYNENNLAAAFVLLLPYIIFLGDYFNKSYLKYVSLLVNFLIFVIVNIQTARIAIIFIFLFQLFYFQFYLKIKDKLVLILIVVTILTGIMISYPREVGLAKTYAKEVFKSLNSETLSIKPSSIKIRISLIEQAIDMCYKSKFVGVGGGNFEEEMQRGRRNATFGIVNAHNFVMELLATNGILITLYFLILIFSLIAKLIRNGADGSRKSYLNLCAGLSLIMFLGSAVLPSSITSAYLYWVNIGFAISVLDISSQEKAIG